MRSRTLSLLAILLLAAALPLGCSTADDAGGGEAAETAAADEEGGSEESGSTPEHTHDDSDARAPYSKPHEVYELAGIEAGDTVLDIQAAGGYNTVLVSERVGPEGTVIAHLTRPEFKDRVGSDESLSNVVLQDDLSQIEDGSVDVVLAIRVYHLQGEPEQFLAEVRRVMKPGATVAVVETRNNEDYGHDMETHRLGDLTVKEDFENAGFELVENSDILRREDDDYTVYVPENRQRYETDRMLMVFRKPAE